MAEVMWGAGLNEWRTIRDTVANDPVLVNK
jgi:hypothetical protein